jgi:tRNA (cytidine/uridine-2'-O-)-methyltransferase
MRTCVATGSVLHLIEPLGFRLDSTSIKRAGVNYIDKLEYHVYSDWDDFISKNTGEFYYFTRYGHKPHSSFDYSDISKNIYLIFGKESTGIPKSILRPNIDRCMRIPMTDNVRALNVSNSVAIVVYEVLRQRNYEGLLFDEPHKDKDFIMLDD